MGKKKNNTWLWIGGAAVLYLLFAGKSPVASTYSGGGGYVSPGGENVLPEGTTMTEGIEPEILQPAYLPFRPGLPKRVPYNPPQLIDQGAAPPVVETTPAPAFSVPEVWSPHYTLGNEPWGIF